MSEDLEARLQALEGLVAKLHAGNSAHLVALDAIVRMHPNPDELQRQISARSEMVLHGDLLKQQGLTPAQRSIAADVLDSLSASLRKGP